MAAMSPIEAAFVSEALEAVDAGAATAHMRDGHSEYWGADQLAKKLESTCHHVDWIFHNTKLEIPVGAEVANVIKSGGSMDDWDDGYLVTRLPNVNGIQMGQSVAGCHIKFGVTSNPEDTSLYENGFFAGIYPDNKAVRGVKGDREVTMARYELNERFTVQILRGGVTVLRNDEDHPFDVIGPCQEEGTSMYGMLHVKEKDALGILENVIAISMVSSIDINGNLLTDVGVERLAPALEVPFSKVTHLDIGLNRMRDKGCIRIAEVLEKHSCMITSLVMSHNEIGDDGATRLAEALGKEGCKVTKIWLTDNMIGDEGAMKLAEALEMESCQLTHIELAFNQIEDEGVQRLLQALSKPDCKVTYFTLDHNKCIDKKTKKMQTAIIAKVPRFVDMT